MDASPTNIIDDLVTELDKANRLTDTLISQHIEDLLNADNRIKELEAALSAYVEALAPFAAAHILHSHNARFHISDEDWSRTAAVMVGSGQGASDGG